MRVPVSEIEAERERESSSKEPERGRASKGGEEGEEEEEEGEEEEGGSREGEEGCLELFFVFLSVCKIMTWPNMETAWFRGNTLRWKTSAHKCSRIACQNSAYLEKSS